MLYTPQEYRTALYRLEYIAMVKARLCALLRMLADPLHSTLPLAAAQTEDAQARIRETIDDLYHADTTLSRQVKETVERERWRRCLMEWGAS